MEFFLRFLKVILVFIVITTERYDKLFLDENFEFDFLKLDMNTTIFYLLFHSRSPNYNFNSPLIINFGHGYGCSVIGEAFYKNGPFMVNSNLTLDKNLFSFLEYADVLYIELPCLIGFSYCNIDSDSFTVMNNIIQFNRFLKIFLSIYKEYKHRKVIFYGENEGSQTVVGIVENLLRNNDSNIKIEILGIVVGNPLIDLGVQYSYIGEYANKYLKINNTQLILAEANSMMCRIAIRKNQDNLKRYFCYETIKSIIGDPIQINYYDISSPCEASIINYYFFEGRCDHPDVSAIYLTLNLLRPLFKTDFPIYYKNCNSTVTQNFIINEAYKKYKYSYDYLLLNKIPIYIYFGEYDLVYNYIGGIEVTNTFKWGLEKEWKKTDFKEFNVGDKTKGKIKELSSLHLIIINKGSHELSIKNPQIVFEIMKKVINQKN